MRAVQPSKHLRVQVYYSPEAHSYWAESPDMNGLAASGKTRKEVEEEALSAAETLFEIKGIKARPDLTFEDAEYPPE
jgi:predicted RNase H-like HicB family nuclease